jgi:hypothetical protein
MKREPGRWDGILGSSHSFGHTSFWSGLKGSASLSDRPAPSLLQCRILQLSGGSKAHVSWLLSADRLSKLNADEEHPARS